MNVTLDKTSGVDAVLTVEVTEGDYKTKAADELKKIRRDATIPGFRKGQVPMSIIDKRFRKQVTSDVINQEVYEAVTKYLQENKVDILGEPLPVEVTEIDLDKQADYTFKYKLGLAPEIDVTLDKEMHLPYYRIEVTQEMVDEQDKAMSGRFGSQETIDTYADRALIYTTVKELGKEEGFIEKENVIIAPWTFKNQEEAKKFEGAKTGDVIVYNPSAATEGNAAELAAMLEVSKEQAAELTGDFQVTITEIKGLKPAEHTEEFFKQCFGEECTTEEQYIDNIRKMIASQLLPNSARLFEMQTRNTLLDKFGKFDLPVEFLKEWLVRRNEELNAETIDEEFAKSEPYMRWEILSGKIGRQLDVKVTKEDLQNYAKHVAARQFAQYGMQNLQEEILAKYAETLLEKEDSRRYIIEQVNNANLFDAIGRAVTIDDHTVSLDEFKKLAEEAEK